MFVIRIVRDYARFGGFTEGVGAEIQIGDLKFICDRVEGDSPSEVIQIYKSELEKSLGLDPTKWQKKKHTYSVEYEQTKES